LDEEVDATVINREGFGLESPGGGEVGEEIGERAFGPWAPGDMGVDGVEGHHVAEESG